MSKSSSHILVAVAWITVLLVFIAKNVPIAKARSITKNPIKITPIFELPNRIDDDDVLQEYGRFMMGIMNQSVDPCENFFEYACGNWKQAAIIPKKIRNYRTTEAVQYNLVEMLIKFLKNSTKDDLKANTAESKAKIFYKSCVQTPKEMERCYSRIWELGAFKKMLLPLLDSKELDWININFISPYGIYPFLPLEIDYDEPTRKYDMIIGPPQLILANLSTTDVKNLIRDLKIKDEILYKNFTEQLQDMIYFETNLTARATKRNETESLKLSEFLSQHKKDDFNWTRYFDVAFNRTWKAEWVLHYDIKNIAPLVRFLNKTSKETMKNYVKWRTLLKFYSIWNTTTEGGRFINDSCRELTVKYFGKAIIPWLIENLFDKDRRADVLSIARQYKETFYNFIDNSTWLDDETKSHAKTKLSAMDVDVGYTDEMLHREPIDQAYSNILMTEDFFENIFILEARESRKRMLLVNKAELRDDQGSVHEVDAIYYPHINTALMTLGILQLPFYHKKFPASLKHGCIGFIISHEIVHGFDTDGYKFNYDGKENNWWTENSLRNFEERFRCLESQYNKYIFRGVPTNGTFTSGDNIADNAAIRIAYNTYMKHHGNRDGDEKPIPSLTFTNKQLLFLTMAQSFCTGEDDSTRINIMKVDLHANDKFRVIGPLSNMPEFSEVFKCKLGSNMNPLKKCIVW